jgi:pimeloyl-ACP methyl ester carboxylesterase
MKLIFVHGAGNTGLVWHYQTKYFTDSEAINLPGHPEGKPCTSIYEYVEWLHQYIQRKGYSEIVVAGHSMGGAVAQMYALSYPQNVKAVILVDTGARLRVKPDFLKLLEQGIGAPSEWLKKIVELSYTRVDPEVREKVINKMLEVGTAVQLNDFRYCDKFDIMQRVNQIAVPTLVICGSKDDMTPVKYSQYLVDKIRGARLVIVEGGMHYCHLEKPAEVNRAIEEFLKSL